MEVNKSQDLLQSASWKLRTSHCIVSIPGPAGLRPGNCQCFPSILRAGKDQCLSSCNQAIRIPPYFGLFVLFRPSPEEGKLLPLAYEFKY